MTSTKYTTSTTMSHVAIGLSDVSTMVISIGNGENPVTNLDIYVLDQKMYHPPHTVQNLN